MYALYLGQLAAYSMRPNKLRKHSENLHTTHVNKPISISYKGKDTWQTR